MGRNNFFDVFLNRFSVGHVKSDGKACTADGCDLLQGFLGRSRVGDVIDPHHSAQ